MSGKAKPPPIDAHALKLRELGRQRNEEEIQRWERKRLKREAQAELRESLKGTMAGRVTQQQVLDAFAAIPAEDQPRLQTWLEIEDQEELVELVEYTLTLDGTLSREDLEAGLAYTLPMVLSRAESSSIHPMLPLRQPLWLTNVWTTPKPRITLVVRANYGPLATAGKLPLPGGKPAVRAVEQLKFEPLASIEERARAYRSGRFGGYAWVFVEPSDSPAVLYIDEMGALRGPPWAELYARLVLGEDVEDT